MKKKEFYRFEDIMNLLSVKKDKAYAIIRELNEELKEKGFITQQGRVNAQYFRERYNLGA